MYICMYVGKWKIESSASGDIAAQVYTINLQQNEVNNQISGEGVGVMDINVTVKGNSLSLALVPSLSLSLLLLFFYFLSLSFSYSLLLSLSLLLSHSHTFCRFLSLSLSLSLPLLGTITGDCVNLEERWTGAEGFCSIVAKLNQYGSAFTGKWKDSVTRREGNSILIIFINII